MLLNYKIQAQDLSGRREIRRISFNVQQKECTVAVTNTLTTQLMQGTEQSILLCGQIVQNLVCRQGNMKINKKVKLSHYRPEQVHRVPGE